MPSMSDALEVNKQVQNIIMDTCVLQMYKQDRICNDSISIGDKIIGASAVLSGPLILTADTNDYPRPFFGEAEEKLITYRKKNKTNMI